MATIPAKDLPTPRLELRWERLNDPAEPRYDHICCYNLVMPLNEYDIRREDEDGNRTRGELTHNLSKTRSSGAAPYNAEYDNIHSPFRDGSHARWDSNALNKLPIYVIAEGRAERMLNGG